MTLTGKISWFGGPNDPMDSGHTASGGTTATPGIAVYNQATLGGYWLITMPNGKRAVVQQTDIGPAPHTGRLLDFTYSLLPHLGYTENNFPTDATATATYLGKTIPKQLRSTSGVTVIGSGTAPSTSSPTSSASSGQSFSSDLLKWTLYATLIGSGGALTYLGTKQLLAKRGTPA